MSDSFFQAPLVVDPLSAWTWGFCAFFAAVFVAVALAAGIIGTAQRWRASIVALSVLLPAVIVLSLECRMFRAVSPSDAAMNWLLRALFVAVPVLFMAIAARWLDLDSLAGTLGLTAGAALCITVLAALFDKLNESMAGIPLSWGTAGILVLLVIALAADSRR